MSTSYTASIWNQEWGQLALARAARSIKNPKWKVGGYSRFGWWFDLGIRFLGRAAVEVWACEKWKAANKRGLLLAVVTLAAFHMDGVVGQAFLSCMQIVWGWSPWGRSVHCAFFNRFACLLHGQPRPTMPMSCLMCSVLCLCCSHWWPSAS
jgi:hypothetical protein